jgi:hypothetical protein
MTSLMPFSSQLFSESVSILRIDQGSPSEEP